MKRSFIMLYKKIFVRRALYRAHQLLFTISLWGLGILNGDNDRQSGEDYFLRNLCTYLPEPNELVVLDVGANRGTYANKIKSLYPNARVYAFEPNPVTFAKLQRAAKEQGYDACNIGISNIAGQAILYDRQSAGGSTHASLYPEAIERLHHDGVRKITINTTTIDEFVEERRISRIHLLKTDTEGSDLNVLLGAKKSLNAGIIDTIQFEFNGMNVFSRVFLNDFRDLLQQYTLYRLLPDGLVSLDGQHLFFTEIFAFQNIVAIRKPASYAEHLHRT